MQVSIINTPTKLDRQRLYRAVQFYAEYLMGKRLPKYISTRVVFTKGLKADADCIWEDDNNRPREFTIRINARMSMTKVLLALAHEMVHVKQYARGELKDFFNRPTTCRFNGVVHDVEKTPYDKLPWEKEAFRLENKLYSEFLVQE
jgi:hypothetical protein